MKPISKIALPVVAMAAAFISSCGGGGESQDYYVSVQQFENGSKGFRFLGSPSCDVYGDGSFAGDHSVSLKQGFVDQMTAVAENSSDNDSDFKQSVEEERDKIIATEDGGTIVNGWVSSTGGNDRTQIAYYVEGGETGKGYLFVTFQSTLGASSDVIHLLGAITPQDIIPQTSGSVSGENQLSVSQAIISSTKGCVLRAVVDFNTGMAQLSLAFQVLNKEEDSDGSTHATTGEWTNVLTTTSPFFAISR